MEMTYRVGDLKKLISESSNEFKAKLGAGVESEDKKNNDKAYSDAKKRAKDYDGGLADEVGEKKAKYVKDDANKTTLDYIPDNATPEYKKRVHAQVKGYTSEKEMNNGIEKNGDYSDNDKIYKELKKSGEAMQDDAKVMKKSGLQAREWPDKTFDHDNMYESKNIKTVYFKKTEFLTEGHMLSRIPDEFKKEGETFKMKDKTGNEYLIEWSDNRGTIISHNNKQGMVESLNRMKDLFNYKSSDTKTTHTDRLNEGDEKFAETLAKMRKIIK